MFTVLVLLIIAAIITAIIFALYRLNVCKKKLTLFWIVILLYDDSDIKMIFTCL